MSSANQTRQRRNAPVSEPSKTGSDSEDIEEIPRRTLIDQIEMSYPDLTPGVPFNFREFQDSLAKQLSSSKNANGITVSEHDVPRAKVSAVRAAISSDADDEDDDDDEELIGDIGQTFFLAVPLTMLLAALYFVVHRQYLEEPDYPAVLKRSAKSFFPIWFILYLTHPRRAWKSVQSAFFFTAITSGCWLVYNVNENGYYAVMKMAPPLGTLLIFSVIEMELVPAFITVLIILGYTWWNKFMLL